MDVQWERSSPIHPAPHFQFLLPEFLGYLWGLFYFCFHLLLCIYYLFIVSITSTSMIKGPFTISRCLTRLRSPLSARILKSLFSSYSQSFRRTVEYSLGNLLATGLLRSWKKRPWSSFSLTGATFPPTSTHTFSFEIPSCCTQYRVILGQEHKAADKRLEKGLDLKKASVADTEWTPVCPWVEYRLGKRFCCFLGFLNLVPTELLPPQKSLQMWACVYHSLGWSKGLTSTWSYMQRRGFFPARHCERDQQKTLRHMPTQMAFPRVSPPKFLTLL